MPQLLVNMEDCESISLLLCLLGQPEHPCMNSTVQHVFNMWASGPCVCGGHLSVYILCLRLAVCSSLIEHRLQSYIIWHILSPDHSLSSDHISLCLCMWNSLHWCLCWVSLWMCMCVCKLICIRTHSRGLDSCRFSSTNPGGCKSG